MKVSNICDLELDDHLKLETVKYKIIIFIKNINFSFSQKKKLYILNPISNT